MIEKQFFQRIFRHIYQNTFLRFSNQIRDPYLIKIYKIEENSRTNELMVDFHVANKRANLSWSVDKFVNSSFLYLTDPKAIFEMGHEHGKYAEKILLTVKKNSIKTKINNGIKRIFIDG